MLVQPGSEAPCGGGFSLLSVYLTLQEKPGGLTCVWPSISPVLLSAPVLSLYWELQSLTKSRSTFSFSRFSLLQEYF